MSAASTAALFATMLVLSAAPGPSDFAVVARSIAAGALQGIVMAGGIVVADFLFIAIAVYGLAEVAAAFGGLFIAVKVGCAAYLIYLGVIAFRPRRPAATAGRQRARASASSFLSGFFITLSDPKAIFFYMGLLPAFLDVANASAGDVVLVMFISLVVVGGVKSTYAVLATRARSMIESAVLRRRLDLAAGAVLAGTGAFVLLETAWRLSGTPGG